MKPDLLLIGGQAPADRARLEERFTVIEYDPAEPDGAISEERRASIAYAANKFSANLDGAFMDGFPALKIIANFGVGYDNIDVEAAATRGIKVTNTPDVLNDDVADAAVLLLLAHVRDSYGAERYLRAGKWASEGGYPLQRKMSGGKVGILGLGRIGRAIAERFVPFGMEIHYWSRSQKETPGWTYQPSVTALAEAVDFLVVITVGGAQTQGLVSAEVLDALGPKGVLVNVARGSVMDEEALISALAEGRIAGAALDVFNNEPDIDPRFFDLPNVTMLPHVASATHETRGDMGRLMVDNLFAALDGAPLLTPVN